MKTRYKFVVVLLALLLAIGIGYYFISPKAVITNLSSIEYDEFLISLPTSRISFSPIDAQSTNTIFFSRQNEPGTASYLLKNQDLEIASGDFLYTGGSELGRVLRFTIERNGDLSVSD